MTIEFVDEKVQERYDWLKTKEDSLISELERVQDDIREIERKEERQ